jgi:hypothetical protein
MKIVSILAMDWVMYSEQISADYEFEPVAGWVHGQVVRETETSVAIAHQVFHEGGEVRHVVVIPKVCIIQRVDHADF